MLMRWWKRLRCSHGLSLYRLNIGPSLFYEWCWNPRECLLRQECGRCAGWWLLVWMFRLPQVSVVLVFAAVFFLCWLRFFLSCSLPCVVCVLCGFFFVLWLSPCYALALGVCKFFFLNNSLFSRVCLINICWLFQKNKKNKQVSILHSLDYLYTFL